MGTQAVVSVTVGGRTAAKVVCGCNGMNAGRLAEAVRKLKVIPSSGEFFEMVRDCDLGCGDCLVAMDAEMIVGGGGGLDPDDLDGGRYRATFDDPRFNPRWARGTADHVEVVDFPIPVEPAEDLAALAEEMG